MTQFSIAQLLRQSFSSPRRTARHLISRQVRLSVLWQALFLLAILLTLIGYSGNLLMGDAGRQNIEQLNLFVTLLIHAILLLVPALLVHVIGERTGGEGRFSDALLLFLWLQVLLLPVQILATLAQSLSWSSSDAILLAYVAMALWLMTNFVTELHGYSSPLNVLLGIMTVLIVMGLLILPFLDPVFAGENLNV
jgi:hypothetical protein